MRRLTLPLIVMMAATAACGGDREADDPPQRVAVWTADSARAAGAEAPAAVVAAESLDSIHGTSQVFDLDASAGSEASGAPAGAAAGSAPPSGGGEPASPGSAAAERTPEAQAPSRSAGTAEEILLRAERAYEAVRTMRATFVQDLTVPLLDSTQRSRGEIFHRKPDRFLMRFSDPEGDRVVADGRSLWLYYPSTDPGQVIRTSAGEAGRLDLQREFLSDPTGRFDATVIGSAEVAGRPATELRLVPRGSEPYRQVLIWIDDQDALARRFEIVETNDNVRRVELHDLRVNVDLGDELFTFTPPAGAEVFDQ